MSEQIISPGVFQKESDQSIYTRGPQVIGGAIVGPTVKGRPLVPTYITSYSQYQSVFGETFKSSSYYYEYFTSLAAKDYFQNGGETLLVTRIISGSANTSTYATADIPSVAGPTTSSFSLEVLAWGDQMNNTSSMVNGSLDSGSLSNVRWEVTNSDSIKGTFTLVVRRGDDTTSQKNILETWSNLSLDPQQPNYISRMIGDLKPVYDAMNGYVNYQGSYNNASQYVRVSSVPTPHVDSIDNNGDFKTSLYATTLPSVGSGSYGGSFDGGVPATGKVQLMNENITTSNIQGFSPADYETAFTLLSNKDEYQYNLLLAPGLGLDTAGSGGLISTVEGRGDAIAIVDNGIYNTSIVQATTNAAGQSSNYGATYYPWTQLYSSNLGKVVWAPPSVVMAGVFAFSDKVSAEWFAPAGLNRGGIPSVIRTERRLQQKDRDVLYNGNVNPLATFPGNGVVAFGQKTLQRKPTSLDRVNVRRLLIALKEFVGGVSRTLIFEQNTAVTRNRFLSQVNPYMESVVQRQGLYAFKVIMDDSNNTSEIIDRNQLVGTIYVQPTKTAEFIILNFNILPTGVDFPS